MYRKGPNKVGKKDSYSYRHIRKKKRINEREKSRKPNLIKTRRQE